MLAAVHWVTTSWRWFSSWTTTTNNRPGREPDCFSQSGLCNQAEGRWLPQRNWRCCFLKRELILKVILKKKKKLLQKGNEEPALNFTLEGMLKTWRANRNLRAVFSETGRTSLLLPSGVLGGNIFLLFSVYKLFICKATKESGDVSTVKINTLGGIV